MAHKPIPVPPPEFKGTLAEWKALTHTSQYRIVRRVKRVNWKKQNPLKVAAQNKKWYQQNKAKCVAYAKEWKQQNPVRVAGHQKKAHIKRERTFYAMFGSQGII